MLLGTLHDLTTTTSIIPVTITPATHCLQSSNLTRQAFIPDDTVHIVPDTIDSFFDFLDTKDEWQRPLLEHLGCNSTEARLHEFLSSGVSIKFTLASDGGARDNLGSYGWEIAIGCEILWQCKGPTFWLKPGSFRAESYGFFSAVLFLQAYTEYYITLSPSTQTHFTIFYATTNHYSNAFKEVSLELGPTRLIASPQTTI